MKMPAFALSVAIMLGVSPSRAQDPYPNEIKDHLALTYAPPCGLCHAKGNTGSGTVVTPFGWAMRGHGLVADDKKTVGTALDSLKAANADSDGDGVSDIAELQAGTDPNNAGAVPLTNGEQPGYGCGGTAPDPNRRGEGVFPPAAVVLLYVLRRITRRAAQGDAS